MNTPNDTGFTGSIPEIYERYLVPMIFEPYARDLASRAASVQPSRVLEIAAGTGVVTRAMADALSEHVEIVATDLNQAMLDCAATLGTYRPVTWQQADAMHLPFDDASFDLIVCQFGAMFFPDKARAFAEARRVLRSGGVLLFNVWDRIEENAFTVTVSDALGRLYAADPPSFLQRVPHGYWDTNIIARDLANGGFDAPPPRIETIAKRSGAGSAQAAAIAFCQGTPIRAEIEARSGATLDEATAACATALRKRFGGSAIDGRIQAHVVTAQR
ncbi:class I SAM-dependent methyltransferase [Paraburkholderia hospita]|uniref:Methyltransferase type 11 n=1 Tax=Paraburkholderia hospita TaxID=169430 RepID=A0AAJ4VMY7_9BURK|nr:class I SAM-dependent methyltransferase [Paraburkholderia hospita]AUT70471.1 SAM-dependent methyltransferase [Paraburkholderia hospita]AXF01470.1 SAM-dependent methyltransferase [Paraburkholderia hospita]EIM99921.1 methyltransferase type 11 [Paraburkholderia hospita]OUL86269.1 SAM-dependent methyltransferase [Paraburkholderia hospita]OUL88337.1 SAM-dependent methyltransferase [Paraburkholderia hospita]